MKPLDQTLKVASIICPGLFVGDVLGAHSVFGLSPNVETHLVWKNLEPVVGLPNWPLTATTTFEECPDVDVLIVGASAPEVISDPEVLAFCQEKAKTAMAVIGICSGVLILGAAGLLEGRRATTNYNQIHLLKEVGIIPAAGGQVVIDDKFYTAGPMMGSFEAAFAALAKLRGEEIAKLMELSFEYNPHPLYNVGSPELAGEELTKKVAALFEAENDSYLKHALAGYKRSKKS